MSEQLKPCPFCGGKAELCAGAHMGRSAIFIQCQKCGAQTKYYIDFQMMNGLTPTQKKAIEAWNRRADQ